MPATQPRQAPRPSAPASRPTVRTARRAPEPLSTRVSRATAAHPVAAFVLHGRRLAFLRQLLALVKAGSGLPLALAQISRFSAPSLRRALERVRTDVDSGSTLGAALRAHVHDLDPASVELIAFAEAAGTLQAVLTRLVTHHEEMQRLRWKALLGALWPLYLVAAEIFVGPLFAISSAVSHGTPRSQMANVYFSGLLTNLALALGTVLALLAFPYAIQLLGLESGWERFKLAIPGVGRVVRDLATSRLYLALSLAHGAGVEVVRTVEIAGMATNQALVRERVPWATQRLRDGGTFAEAVELLGLVPREALGSIAVAESAGTLEETLGSLARDAEEAAVRGVRLLTLAVLAIVAAVALVGIVRQLMGTLFGPVYDYFHLQDGL